MAKRERVQQLVQQRAQVLAKQELDLACCSVVQLRDKLRLLGEKPSGTASEQQLRRQLARRLYAAQCAATRFPLRHTARHGSKSYIVVPIDIQDVGMSDFLLDTGTRSALITSALRDEMGLSPVPSQAVPGLQRDVALTLTHRVRLPQLRLGPHQLDITDGCVTSLQHDLEPSVGGVLGLRFLSSYDVELDPAAGHIAFHPIGHVQQGIISTAGCCPISCTTTKGGFLAVSVSLNGCPPFPGILDLGATVSTINWAAARAAQQAAASGPPGASPASRGLNATLPPAQKPRSSSGNGAMLLHGGLDVVLGDPSKGEAFKAPHTAPLILRDVPILGLLGYQSQPAMVVGRDLIGRTRTVFNLAERTIWLQPPAAPPAPAA